MPEFPCGQWSSLVARSYTPGGMGDEHLPGMLPRDTHPTPFTLWPGSFIWQAAWAGEGVPCGPRTVDLALIIPFWNNLHNEQPAALTWLCPDIAPPDFHQVPRSIKSLRLHHCASNEGPQNAVLQGLQRMENFYWGEYTLLFKGGILCTTLQNTMKNNYAFSDAAVKSCEISTCPACKEHEI